MDQYISLGRHLVVNEMDALMLSGCPNEQLLPFLAGVVMGAIEEYSKRIGDSETAKLLYKVADDRATYPGIDKKAYDLLGEWLEKNRKEPT